MPGGEGLRPTYPKNWIGTVAGRGGTWKEASCCKRSPGGRKVPAGSAEQPPRSSSAARPGTVPAPGARPAAADKGAAGSPAPSLTTRSWRRPPARCSCRGARRRGPVSARSWWAAGGGAGAAPAEPAAGTGRPAEKHRNEALERGLRAAGAQQAQPGLPPPPTPPPPPPAGPSPGRCLPGAPAAALPPSRPRPGGRGRAAGAPPRELPRPAQGERGDVWGWPHPQGRLDEPPEPPGSPPPARGPWVPLRAVAQPGAPRLQVCGEPAGHIKAPRWPHRLCNAGPARK